MGLERINEIRKEKGMSVDELSKISGVPKGTLSKITAGITKNPNLETVKSIAIALGCSMDEFDSVALNKEFSRLEQEFVNKYRALDAHGRKVVDFILNEEYERITVPANTVALAYYPDIIPAGEGEYGSQDTEIINYPVDKLLPGTDIVVRMRGITMEPTYHSGDMLCVKKASRINKGDIGVFVVDGRGIVAELGVDKLITHNTVVADIPLTPGVRCVGRVLGVY